MLKGFKNILFGGEGLFLATLTGPGTIWLQSMPIMNLAEELMHYLPNQASGSQNNIATTVGAGVVGAALGGLFSDKKD